MIMSPHRDTNKLFSEYYIIPFKIGLVDYAENFIELFPYFRYTD